MRQKDGTKVLINAGLLGLGAVALIQIANKFAPTIMGNQFLQYGFYGITLGAVLVAAIGIYAIENLILQ